MTLSVLCALILGVATALPQKHHPLSDEAIDKINSRQSTWHAERYFEDYEFFKVIATGSKKPSEDLRKQIPLKVYEDIFDIPDSFDARETWPECADIIGMIRDQSRCGSCWAFAAVETMSDRICIHSNGKRKLILSAQDLLTCGLAGGCDGGVPQLAWISWISPGIVTGGQYNNTEQGCRSYFLPSCEDHPNNCTDYVDTPTCVIQCDNSSVDYVSDKTYGMDVYAVTGEQQIQIELMQNGPVEASFEVYSDFANYKSGIYQRTSGEDEGGHDVKIIGWGVENGTKYWLIANSWNEHWGENGYFRILRGVDEVGIESSITAGFPDFSRF